MTPVVLRVSRIPFRSAYCFQYRHTEEGSGDLGPLRANEIAEYIIRADFVT